MKSLPRFRSTLLIVPILAVLAAASGILFHSLENDRTAELARQERFMRNAAFSVVDDLGSELFSMFSAFSYDLRLQQARGGIVDRATLTAALDRYRAQARFPDLLPTLACLSVGPHGGYTFGLWTQQGWSEGPRPAWATELVPPVPRSDELVPQPRAAFSLEHPVLTVLLRPRRSVEGEVVAVALRFSPQVVLEQIVPTLVRQRFAEGPEAPFYRASVHNRDVAPAAPSVPVDWEVPLLPWTPLEGWFDYYVNRLQTIDRSRLAFERLSLPTISGENPGTGWVLTITRLPGGLAAEMTGLFWKNVGWSLGFFLFLSLGFWGLYQSARRARVQTLQERTFLALISHELKTPLAVVRSLADNLARGIGTNEARAKEYGEVLRDQSTRLTSMVENVLGFTTIQGGVPARDRVPVDLEAIVRDRLSRHAADRNDVTVTVAFESGLGSVLGHPSALGAAVDNLIGNAYRHGAVSSGPHKIAVTLGSQRRWGTKGVLLTIEDDGPGFSRSEGKSFRRPFHRGQSAQETQTPGSGVGLSLAVATARALGGRLWWDGRPGVGACFYLWLREVARER